MRKRYEVIGLMSGTSLDGLDLVKCSFVKKEKWLFTLQNFKTHAYNNKWTSILKKLHKKPKKIIEKYDLEYSKYLSSIINDFILNEKLNVEFVSSHGHTIFHEPDKKVTLQIGKGSIIASKTKKTTISDFRTLDVALGGQGAPLVPIGDLHLFSEYKYCLNLGGFSNVSVKNGSNISAYDICSVNFVLNHLAKKLNKDYDENGNMAANGKIDPTLLIKLNKLDFYHKIGPKSLSREWVEKNIDPIINDYPSTINCLTTYCEHIAYQIGSHLNSGKTLVTGGGAFNKYLINRIKQYSKSKIIVPDDNIVNYKEAIIFAFLGVLKLRNEINCLSSVTGAKTNTSSGKIFAI